LTYLSQPRLALLCVLFFVETLMIVAVYQFGVSVECRASAAELWCQQLRGSLGRGITVIAALSLYFVARPTAGKTLMALSSGATSGLWPAIHASGVLLIFSPVILFGPALLQDRLETALPIMASGALAGALGGAFWMVSPRGWAAWLADQRGVPIWLALIAALLPEAATMSGMLWNWDWLARPTFQAVALIMSMSGLAVMVDVSEYIIGANDFFVQIAAACSGVEGLALVTGFVGLYAVLFRDTLRQRRLWLVLWPLALGLSWVFNVIRIAVLVMIGVGGAPDLAVNGFHSYAGWLAFTILALLILALAQSLPWLHRNRAVPSARIPLLQDWDAARILPFVVFMISGIVVSAFWTAPEAGYPWRVIAMALSLALFSQVYARLEWRPNALSLAAGGVVGIVWIFAGLASGAQATITDLAGPISGAALVLWIGARLVGTIFLVPMIEELFFRGYLHARIDDGSMPLRVLAFTISAVGFALLHGQWLAAGLASLVFSALLIRRGRVSDAVAAHVAANAVVALWAVSSGNWALI